MKLSKKGEYAVRAMLLLAVANRCGYRLVRIGEITAVENIPTPFLEQIFIRLRSAGLVRSRRGKHGGYVLAKPADNITIGEIIRLVDGPLSPISCVSRTAYQPCNCPDEATCGLRAIMLRVRDATSKILDETTLAHQATFILQTLSQQGRQHPIITYRQKHPRIDPLKGFYEI
jgi:Rrf2 family protein